MFNLCRRIASSRRFQNGALAVIVANAVLIGAETSPALWERYGGVFNALNAAVQVVFAVEIAVRLLAFGPRVHRFFLDGWNVFDFTIVALSLLPVAGPFAMVEKTVTIKNRAGIHARPAALLVETASRFRSSILLEKDGERINSKSIMGILTLAATYNTVLRVIAEGADEREALEAVSLLFENKFQEE